MSDVSADAVYPTEELKTIFRQGTYRLVPLDSIQIAEKPNLKDRSSKLFFNPRASKGFSDTDMSDLEDSIAVKGLIQPIAVRDLGNESYQLVWGERRTRAIRSLVARDQDVYVDGGEMLPASIVYQSVYCRILTDCDDERAIGLAWAENDKHVPLSDADAIDLCHRLATMGYSRLKIGDLLQKSPGWISHTFSFPEKLPPQVYAMLRQNEISRSYAIKIMEQPQELRDELARLAGEIAIERHEAQVSSLDEELDEVEEALIDAETKLVLADSESPAIQEKVRKRLARVEQKAADVVARVDKVKNSRIVHQQGDVDEASKRKGLQGGKGLTVKSIYANYINRTEDLLKSGQDPQTGRSFSERDLGIVKVVATGIAQGEKNLDALLRGHYDEQKLWEEENSIQSGNSSVRLPPGTNLLKLNHDDEEIDELEEIPDDEVMEDGEDEFEEMILEDIDIDDD